MGGPLYDPNQGSVFDPSSENILDKLARQNARKVDEAGLLLDQHSQETEPLQLSDWRRRPVFFGRTPNPEVPQGGPAIPQAMPSDYQVNLKATADQQQATEDAQAQAQRAALYRKVYELTVPDSQKPINWEAAGGRGLPSRIQEAVTSYAQNTSLGELLNQVADVLIPDPTKGALPPPSFEDKWSWLYALPPEAAVAGEGRQIGLGIGGFVDAIKSAPTAYKELATSVRTGETIQARLDKLFTAVASASTDPKQPWEMSSKEFFKLLENKRADGTLAELLPEVENARAKVKWSETTGDPLPRSLYNAYMEQAILDGKTIPAEAFGPTKDDQALKFLYELRRQGDVKLGPEMTKLSSIKKPDYATTLEDMPPIHENTDALTQHLPILRSDGKQIGNIEGRLVGTTLHVPLMAAKLRPVTTGTILTADEGEAGAIGIRGIRSLLNQLADRFPTATVLQADPRVTGMHTRGGTAAPILRFQIIRDANGARVLPEGYTPKAAGPEFWPGTTIPKPPASQQAATAAVQEGLDSVGQRHDEAQLVADELAQTGRVIQDAPAIRANALTDTTNSYHIGSVEETDAAYRAQAALNAAQQQIKTNAANQAAFEAGAAKLSTTAPTEEAETLYRTRGRAILDDMSKREEALQNSSIFSASDKSFKDWMSRGAALFNPAARFTTRLKAALAVAENRTQQFMSLGRATTARLMQDYRNIFYSGVNEIDRSKVFLDGQEVKGVPLNNLAQYLHRRVGFVPNLDRLILDTKQGIISPAELGAAQTEVDRWGVAAQFFDKFLDPRTQWRRAGTTDAVEPFKYAAKMLRQGGSDVQPLISSLLSNQKYAATFQGAQAQGSAAIEEFLDSFIQDAIAFQHDPKSVLGQADSVEAFQQAVEQLYAYRNGNMNPYVPASVVNKDITRFENPGLYNMTPDGSLWIQRVQETLHEDQLQQKQVGINAKEFANTYFSHVWKNAPDAGDRVSGTFTPRLTIGGGTRGINQPRFYTDTISGMAAGYEPSIVDAKAMINRRLAISGRMKADALLRQELATMSEAEKAQATSYLFHDPNSIVHGLANGSAVLREAIATADLSYMFAIQGMQRFAANPAGYINDLIHATAYLTDQGFDGWVLAHIDELLEAEAHGLSLSHALDFGPAQYTPLEGLLNLTKKLPLPGASEVGGGDVLRYLNTMQYERLATIFKLNTYRDAQQLMKTARDGGMWAVVAQDLKKLKLPVSILDPVGISRGLTNEQINLVAAEHTNNVLGGLHQAIIGRSQQRRDLERISLFAPDFTRSKMNLVGSAFRPDAQGMLARTHLFSYYANAAMMAAGLTFMTTGEMPNLTDRSRPDFLVAHTPWGDVNLIGPFKNLVRDALRPDVMFKPLVPGESRLAQVGLGIFNPRQLTSYGKSREGPLVQLLQEQVFNQDFLKNPIVTSRDGLEGLKQRVFHVLKSWAPVSYQQASTAADLGVSSTGRAATIGAGLLGANVISYSPQQEQTLKALENEAVKAGVPPDIAAAEARAHRDPLLAQTADRRILNSAQRDNARAAVAKQLKMPLDDVVSLGVPKVSSAEAKTATLQELTYLTTHVAAQTKEAIAALSPDLSDPEYRKQVQAIKTEGAAVSNRLALDPKYREAIDYAKTQDPKRLLKEPVGQALKEAFFADVFDSTINKESGEPDFLLRDQRMNEWQARLGLDTITSFMHEKDAQKPARLLELEKAQEDLRPYWDIPKTVLTKEQLPLYEEFKKQSGVGATTFLLSHQDIALAVRIIQRDQQLMRRDNPKIDALLAKWYDRRPSNVENIPAYYERIQNARGAPPHIGAPPKVAYPSGGN